MVYGVKHQHRQTNKPNAKYSAVKSYFFPLLIVFHVSCFTYSPPLVMYTVMYTYLYMFIFICKFIHMRWTVRENKKEEEREREKYIHTQHKTPIHTRFVSSRFVSYFLYDLHFSPHHHHPPNYLYAPSNK